MLLAAAQDMSAKPPVDYTNLPPPCKYEDMSREIMCKPGSPHLSGHCGTRARSR